jgi:ubiquinone/menaquinone biosynthesis C-methylase UbiE
MIGIAQRKANASNVGNVTFEHSSFDDFEAPDGHFDAVFGLT